MLLCDSALIFLLLLLLIIILFMSYKGKFKPKNYQKYKGNPTNITYRSLLERRFMVYCDETSSILEWSSEEVVVPYVSPVDNRYHRYFVDFWMKYKDKHGEIKSVLIEVKPDIQTRPPVRKNTPNGKPTRRFINEVMTWGVNQAKWEAATKYSIERNWEFKIITDKDLR